MPSGEFFLGGGGGPADGALIGLTACPYPYPRIQYWILELELELELERLRLFLTKVATAGIAKKNPHVLIVDLGYSFQIDQGCGTD
jgi:hypothetical protein